MFDKDLSDIEELERLKDLEKAQEVQRRTIEASSIDDFLNINMSLEILNQLPPSLFFNRTIIEGSYNSLDI